MSCPSIHQMNGGRPNYKIMKKSKHISLKKCTVPPKIRKTHTLFYVYIVYFYLLSALFNVINFSHFFLYAGFFYCPSPKKKLINQTFHYLYDTICAYVIYII